MFTFIEVCTGAGGLSSGLIKSGLTPVLLVENNKDCCETLKKNHKNITVLQKNFEDINYTDFINNTSYSGIDLLCGGVPCQAFSIAGKRNGLNDNRGELIMKFINLVKIIKPKVFFIENVKGLLSLKDVFKEVLTALSNLNEYTIKYEVLNAWDYNVPQKRERLFIVGSLNKFEFNFPEKNPKKPVLKDILTKVPKSPGFFYPKTKIELFTKIPPGGCWVDLPKQDQIKYLGNSYSSPGGKRGILRRLSMDEPSLTLLCSPSQKQTERCHPNEIRPLTTREYARIQTFDDAYVFVGSISSIYKQIGNAVPVNLAKAIGEQIIKTLKNE